MLQHRFFGHGPSDPAARRNARIPTTDAELTQSSQSSPSIMPSQPEALPDMPADPLLQFDYRFPYSASRKYPHQPRTYPRTYRFQSSRSSVLVRLLRPSHSSRAFVLNRSRLSGAIPIRFLRSSRKPRNLRSQTLPVPLLARSPSSADASRSRPGLTPASVPPPTDWRRKCCGECLL